MLGLRATGMMHCSLASNSSLDHDQFNEIRWKLRRRFPPPNSVVDCSWLDIPALVNAFDFYASIKRVFTKA